MSIPGQPEPVKLVFGALIAGDFGEDAFLRLVAGEFGEIERESGFLPFAHTSYYEKEMGENLLRTFISMKEPVEPDALADLKLRSNAIEARTAVDGRRRVNLDAGTLSLTQLVLASCKSAGHRVYVGKGVFAEIEYVYQCGTFKPLEWTYPDYKEPGAVGFFNEVRAGLKAALRKGI